MRFLRIIYFFIFVLSCNNADKIQKQKNEKLFIVLKSDVLFNIIKDDTIFKLNKVYHHRNYNRSETNYWDSTTDIGLGINYFSSKEQMRYDVVRFARKMDPDVVPDSCHQADKLIYRLKSKNYYTQIIYIDKSHQQSIYIKYPSHRLFSPTCKCDQIEILVNIDSTYSYKF